MNSTETLYLVTFIIVIILISFLAYVVIKQPILEQNIKGKDTNPISSDYFNPIPQWQNAASFSSTTETNNQGNNLILSNLLNAGYNVQNQTSVGQALETLGNCTVYTYENNYNVETKPNLNNLYDAVNSGLAHPSQNVPCLDSDQIMAYQSIHICEKDNCISVNGNKITQGDKEIFLVNCQNEDVNIPTCDGGIYNISLNFNQSSLNGIVGTSTTFLTISEITVPQTVYDSISDFYKESGIFVADSSLKDVEYYKTIITSEIYQTSNYKQRFRIIRYTWDGKQFNVDPQGFFTEIIFRPLNLRLSYKDNSYVFIPKLDNSYSPTWLLLPPMDISPKRLSDTQRAFLATDLTVSNTTIVKSAKDNKLPPPSPDTFLRTQTIGAGGQIIDTSYLIANDEILNECKYNKTLIPSNNKWSNIKLNWNWTSPDIKTIKYKYIYLNGDTVSPDNSFYKHFDTHPEVKTYGYKKTLTGTYTYTVKAQGDISTPDNYLSVYNFLDQNTVIVDNDVLWQRKPLFEDVSIFTDEYFFDKSYKFFSFKNNFKNFTNSDFVIATTDPVTYIDIKQGLLNAIDYSGVTYDKNTGTSPFSTFIESNTVTGLSGTARFALNFQSSPGDNKLKIFSYTIPQPGQDCNSVNTDLTTNGIRVKGISFIATSQDVIYRDVGTSTSGGMTLQDVTLSNSNKKISKATVNNIGYGYLPGQTIYIVQTDSFGNILTQGLTSTTLTELYSNETDQKKLNSLKITQSMLQQIDNIANYNLMRGGVDITEFSPDVQNIDYSYFDNDANKKITYNKSPPQIAFLDTAGNAQISLEILNLLKSTTDPKIIENYINSSSNGIYPPNTNVQFLKTLQYQTLNYSKDQNNNIDAIQPLILGRFIPYSDFTYQYTPSNTKYQLYNGNYTQFIPYGIEHIYERYIDPSKLPVF